MVLMTRDGKQTGEDVDDLRAWLRALSGCPAVDVTVVARCAGCGNDGETSWFYVEADAVEGVARRRCIACAQVTPLLDSVEHWTFPPAWGCRGCGQSIAEVGFGVHSDDGLATWVAMAVRCVGCGAIEGLTDVHVGGVPVEALAL